MSILNVVYASAPTDILLLATLEIRISGLDPIYLIHGFKDRMLGVNGDMKNFIATNISIALPAKNTTGQQNLTFGLANVNGQVQRYVEHALETDVPAKIIYREYIDNDISQPANNPIEMDISGGQFEGGEVRIEASFYDLLNVAWPRERYNQNNAPGIRYI